MNTITPGRLGWQLLREIRRAPQRLDLSPLAWAEVQASADAVARVLAAALGVAATTVSLATGDSSPLKTFEIDGLDDATIRDRLGGKAPAK